MESIQRIGRYARQAKATPVKPVASPDVGGAFERWWRDEGSGMPPLPGEDTETHVRRVAEIAWSNGAYIEKLKTEQCAAERRR